MIDKFFSRDDYNFWRCVIGAHLVIGHLRLAHRVWTEDSVWLFLVQAPILAGGLVLMLLWVIRVGRL